MSVMLSPETKTFSPLQSKVGWQKIEGEAGIEPTSLER